MTWHIKRDYDFADSFPAWCGFISFLWPDISKGITTLSRSSKACRYSVSFLWPDISKGITTINSNIIRKHRAWFSMTWHIKRDYDPEVICVWVWALLFSMTWHIKRDYVSTNISPRWGLGREVADVNVLPIFRSSGAWRWCFIMLCNPVGMTYR